jgi:hypothetical protein
LKRASLIYVIHFYNNAVIGQWPAILFKSWSDLQEWNISLPPAIAAQAVIPALPSGTVAIALFCGPKMEFGLVKDGEYHAFIFNCDCTFQPVLISSIRTVATLCQRQNFGR